MWSKNGTSDHRVNTQTPVTKMSHKNRLLLASSRTDKCKRRVLTKTGLKCGLNIYWHCSCLPTFDVRTDPYNVRSHREPLAILPSYSEAADVIKLIEHAAYHTCADDFAKLELLKAGVAKRKKLQLLTSQFNLLYIIHYTLQQLYIKSYINILWIIWIKWITLYAKEIIVHYENLQRTVQNYEFNYIYFII